MRKSLILLLLAGIVLFATACPRDKGTEETAAGDTGMTSGSAERGAGQTDQADGAADSTGMDAEDPGAATDGQQPEGEVAPAEGTAGQVEGAPGEPGETQATEEGVVNVILQTTKGDIKIAVHPDWAPIGAAHFLELVRAKYYDGAPWFRVIPGFMCQTGLAADPAVTAQWQNQTIQDEPVVKGNLPGTVSFGRSGAPNSRSTHIFINYADNSRLDAQGFPAFGEVIEGMEVAEALFATGENPNYVQPRLSAEGIDFFRSEYPKGDVITKATVEE
jgi:cyclophilin family peptidyl-prolyl cis-trans isomerase